MRKIFLAVAVVMATMLAFNVAGSGAVAVQIGQDAIPLLGNSERKAANVQIAKATKAFPLLKQLMDSQRSMAKRYFRPANVEVNDSVDEAIVSNDVDFMETMEMTDEELDAYIAAEQAGV